jgi:predicted HicB family RNase H-like nuclease
MHAHESMRIRLEERIGFSAFIRAFDDKAKGPTPRAAPEANTVEVHGESVNWGTEGRRGNYMSGDTLEYKGYVGSVEVDLESQSIVGKLLCIRDTITYSADSVSGIEKAFQDAVNDYLALCAEEGSAPDTPFKGSFNVRVGEALHRAVAVAARHADVTLNDYVKSALEMCLAPIQTVVHKHQVEVEVVSTAHPQEFTTRTSNNTPRRLYAV